LTLAYALCQNENESNHLVLMLIEIYYRLKSKYFLS